MIEAIRTILRNLFTGKDGETHDIARVSWAAGILSVIGGGIWNALHAGLVDMMALAQAIGVVVAAHGGALWAKKDTEPGADK